MALVQTAVRFLGTHRDFVMLSGPGGTLAAQGAIQLAYDQLAAALK